MSEELSVEFKLVETIEDESSSSRSGITKVRRLSIPLIPLIPSLDVVLLHTFIFLLEIFPVSIELGATLLEDL